MAQEMKRGTTGGRTTGSPGPAEAGGARIAGKIPRHEDAGPGPEIMAASSFEGEAVVDGHGDTLGEIEEVMMDVRSGRIAYAVMSVGGFLGIGEKYFAIPWSALTLDVDHKHFVLDVDKDRLKDAPGFDKDQWPSMADDQWAATVHSYFGTRPYWE